MRALLVIGIGTGDPEQLTMQAIAALNRADVVFLADKAGPAADLTAFRRELCARYARREPRFVAIDDPPRDRASPAYRDAVDDWRERRRGAWGAAIAAALGPDECGAFLVWGDPSLYDGTIAILDDLALDFAVIPGISAIQALAAAHRIALNRVGRAVQITPGRLLRDGWPADAPDDLVVMLDASSAFRAVAGEDVRIYWGAYLGSPDELLVSGPLTEPVMAEIERVRHAARERKGWVMDTYLLRR